jgi:retron-type reverse transcriptase
VHKAKPFKIPKREVWEAFKRVRANQGAAGVDGQSIAEFEANLSGNLYKLWNRLSSGSYFPPPVWRVEIPKASGGTQHRLGAFTQGGPPSTDRPWVLLYIERWLKAPVQMEDGSIMPRMAGTPQGGVMAP